MMREQPAGDRRHRSTKAEGADLDPGGVEADETGGGLIIAHRANSSQICEVSSTMTSTRTRIAQIQIVPVETCCMP